MSEDRVSVTGVVASTPKHIVTAEGLHITSFRLASNSRRYDRASQSWVDADTNWFTVTAFRQLANNISTSVGKGERVAVQGKLRVRTWTNGEKSGVQVEIEADSVGHDLTWGTSLFTRTLARVESAEAPGDDGDDAEPDAADDAARARDEFVPDHDSVEMPQGWPSVAAG